MCTHVYFIIQKHFTLFLFQTKPQIFIPRFEFFVDRVAFEI